MRKIILPHQTYFITTNIHDRQSIFVNRETMIPNTTHCDILVRNLEWYKKKFVYTIQGFVIMPDHVHLLLTVGAQGTIIEIMRDFKHRTAFEINKLNGTEGKLWQHDFWEHSIRNSADFDVKLNYIHMNPVRAGFLEDPTLWKYSSASWYVRGECPLVINPIG